MKKIIFFLLSLTAFFTSDAQWTKPNNSYGIISNRASFDSTLMFPAGCGAPSLRAVSLKKPAQYMDTCNHRLWIYDPKTLAWDSLHVGAVVANAWGLNGTAGTTPATNFIGTTDAQDLVVKTNSQERVRVKSGGNVHIKDTTKTSNFASRPYDSADYEIIVFPDIQNMIRHHQAWSRSMFKWVADNKTSKNIKALIQVGDITDWNTTAEWDTLASQLSLVTATGLPYIMPPGNHDYGNGFNPSSRDSAKYNSYLGVSHFSGKPFYGGHYGVSNENYWIHFTAGDRKYVAVGLEFIPRDTVLKWAGAVIDSVYNADPSVEVIVVTHAYISQLGELATDTAYYSGNTYGMGADNSGAEIWQKLIRSRPNIKWVFSGHFLVPNTHANRGLTSRIVGVGDNGNLVNQIFVNYQDDVNWGDGYFMRLQFKPTKGTVDVKFYTSYADSFDTRQESYVLEDPSISVRTSLGVKNDITVGRDLRVEGTAKFKTLSPFRIPFTIHDSRFRDTDSLMYYPDSSKLAAYNIRAKLRLQTDSLEFNYAKMISKKNGKTRILFGDPLTKLYLQEIFDSVRTDGNLSRTALYAFSAIDSGHKMARGYMIRGYKSFEPVDGFTSSYLGSNVYNPEQTNRFDTRWYLPKGSFTINGFIDFPNANVYNSLDIGSRIDSTDITFGSTVFTGMMNNAARTDLAPNASQYTNNYGMISNYASLLKGTRKVNSSINWFNHYAVAGTQGTDNGQILKTMVGYYVEPMQIGFTRRLWGYLQTGSTGTYNAMNRLFIGGDTTVANSGDAVLYTDGTVRMKNTGAASSDTTSYKPVGMDADGDIVQMTHWPGGGAGSGVPTSRQINTTAPLAGGGDLTADRTLSIANAAADGTTKGAASFGANDFNATSGNITIDYVNGQKATSSQNGFMSAADKAKIDSNQYVKPGEGIDTVWVNDSTLMIKMKYDTTALASFGAGAGLAGDTAAFSTSSLYGSFYNSGSDTLIITRMQIGLQGTSPDITVDVFWNDSLNVSAGATKLVTAGSSATNIYTGTSVTSFNNTKIPPGNWIWTKTSAVAVKPTYFSMTLIGYKKRVTP